MSNLNNTLDIVIAVVVVLLVLSLVVQAIQAFIKKVFRLKSREIEKSLAELFETVIDKTSAGTAAPITSQEMVKKVLAEFNHVGRYTKFGRTVLDSISKEDLLKILARVDSKYFLADYADKFQEIYTEIQALEQEINRLITQNPPLLQGVASAKFVEMQAVVTPIINDIKNIVTGNAVKQDALLGDIVNLRHVKLADAMQILAAAQEAIAADQQRAAGSTATIAALQQLSASLATIAGILGQLNQRMDAAFATLRAKLDHVEAWYDTVMQSFEERYTRHMKNVSIYVAIGVVVYLNANFFRIYRDISTNDAARAFIVEQAPKVLDEAKKNSAGNSPARSSNTTSTANANTASNANSGSARNSNAGGNTNANTSGNITSPNETNSSNAVNNDGGSRAANEQPTPTPSPVVTVEDLKQQANVIRSLAATYEGFGFSPLTLQQARIWVRSVFGYKPLRNQEGALIYEDGQPIPRDCQPTAGRNCEPSFRGMQSFNEWWASRKHDFSVLIGWTLMVLLLSVGAPFWQDTLESLFGVKNLLRKKSDTQNVERESGTGQTRQ